MVFDYKILPLRNEDVDATQEIRGFAERRKTVSRKFKRDRRKARQDRRKGVRDGVIVNLSCNRRDRRRGGDRRRTFSEAVPKFQGSSSGFVV